MSLPIRELYQLPMCILNSPGVCGFDRSSVGETAAGTTIEEYIEGFEKDFEDKVIGFGRVVISK